MSQPKNKLELFLMAKDLSKHLLGLTKKEICCVADYVKQFSEKAADNCLIDLETEMSKSETLFKQTPLSELNS